MYYAIYTIQAGDPAAGVAALDEGLDTDKLTHRMRVTFHTLKATLHMSRGDGTSAIESYNAAAGTKSVHTYLHSAIDQTVNVYVIQ